MGSQSRAIPRESGELAGLLFVGVDPGIYGAIVVINGLSEVVAATIMPTYQVYRDKPAPYGRGIHRFLSSLPVRPTLAAIERVWGRPGQGVKAAFSFGFGTGQAMAAFSILRINATHPTPKEWQGSIIPLSSKVYRDIQGTKGRKGRRIHDTKASSIKVCRALFPELHLGRVPHDGLADAACLAEYARRRFLL